MAIRTARVTLFQKQSLQQSSVKAVKAAAFKPVTSYTINAANSKSVALSGKPAEVPVAFSYLQNGNVGGQPNKFRDLFELRMAF